MSSDTDSGDDLARRGDTDVELGLRLDGRSAEHTTQNRDLHYDAIQAAMKGVFHELGLAA